MKKLLTILFSVLILPSAFPQFAVNGVVTSNSIVPWAAVTNNPSVAIAMFSHFNAVVAKMPTQSNAVIIACLGDSTTAGVGATTNVSTNYFNMAANSYPSQLAGILSSYGLPAVNGAIVGQGVPRGFSVAQEIVADPRLAATNFGFYTNINTLAGYLWYSTNAGTLAFTPTNSWDSCRVYYATGIAGSGNLSVSLGTNSPVTFSQTGSTNFTNTGIITKALGVGAVTITGTGNVNFLAIDTWDSTHPAIHVMNCGIASEGAGQLSDTSSLANSQAIRALSPDLAIVNIGINDANISEPASQYQGYLQTIVTNASASGNVIVSTWMPNSSTSISYNQAMQYIAEKYGAAFLDQGIYFGNYASVTNNGLIYDTTHPNIAGCNQFARDIARALTY